MELYGNPDQIITDYMLSLQVYFQTSTHSTHAALSPTQVLVTPTEDHTVTCRGKAAHTVLALDLLMLLLQGLGGPDGITNPPLCSQLFRSRPFKPVHNLQTKGEMNKIIKGLQICILTSFSS